MRPSAMSAISLPRDGIGMRSRVRPVACHVLCLVRFVARGSVRRSTLSVSNASDGCLRALHPQRPSSLATGPMSLLRSLASSEGH